MRRSTERMLTTHVGSLPRPADVLEGIAAADAGRPLDAHDWRCRVQRGVAEVVGLQVEHGLDVVNDGELGKPSFLTYVTGRLDGFQPSQAGEPASAFFAGSKEAQAFPEFYAWQSRTQTPPAIRATRFVCAGPIAYTGHDQVQADIANLGAALMEMGRSVEEAFISAISPSSIENEYKNDYYASDEDYLVAIADAMREEYKAIVDAGFLVQIDDPRLVTYYALTPRVDVTQSRSWAELRIEALNYALRDIPEDKIRFHTCYSINMGPRVHDMELKDIVDLILKIRAGAYSFEAANPRHEHEWRVWQDVRLPDGKVLIPGVITQSSVLVEHPDLVAERIGRFASVVGRERVIAGADCGFASFAGSMEIHPRIAWAKFDALVEGARRASRQLWAHR